jgi:hypothetical protein
VGSNYVRFSNFRIIASAWSTESARENECNIILRSKRSWGEGGKLEMPHFLRLQSIDLTNDLQSGGNKF